MVATVIQGDPPTRHLHHLCVVDGHLAMNTGAVHRAEGLVRGRGWELPRIGPRRGSLE
jgi:hypothetical protein